MSIIAIQPAPEVSEQDLDRMIRELHLTGTPHNLRDPKSVNFVSSLDGKVDSAIDSSSITIKERTLVIRSEDADEESAAPALDFGQLYAECFKAQKAFHETYVDYYKCISDDVGVDVAVDRASVKKTFVEIQANISKVRERLEKKQKEKENQSVSGFRSRLRSVFESFQERSPDIQAFLQILPAGSEYGSLICGGLSIVFQAIDSFTAMEPNICQALEDIQGLMREQAYASDIYRNDPIIHELMSGVCASIFNLLGYILGWIKQKWLSKLGKSVGRPATYGEELSELRAIMQRQSQRLLSHACMLSQGRLHRVEQIVGDMSKDQKALKLQIMAILKLASECISSAKEQDDAKQRHHKQLLPSLPIVTNIEAMVSTAPAMLDIDGLLNAMRYDRDLVCTDYTNIIRGTRFDAYEQRKVNDLSKDVRLKAFIEVDNSAVLLIQGGNSRHQPRSAVSYVTAKTVETLSQFLSHTNFIHVLAFFCGEHRVESTKYSTPRDLMITLILQLVDQCQTISLEALAQAGILETFRYTETTVGDMCKLLRTLVNALPESSILFCVIDGISFFDTGTRSDDIETIVQFLLRMARKRLRKPRGARFKVLFTTPSRAVRLTALFESYEVFTLYQGHHSNSNSSLGRSLWEAGGLSGVASALSDSEV